MIEMYPNKKSKFDKLWIGLLFGICTPILLFIIFYYSAFSKVSLAFFIEHTRNIHVLGRILSLGAVPNLGIFFLFMWRNHLRAARGVILATIILAFIILVFNFTF